MDRGDGEPRSAASDRSVFSRLKRGTIEALVLHAAGVGLVFLMHATFARIAGPGGYGGFSAALATATLLALVAPLGWPTALLRFIAEYTEGEKWGLLRGALRRAYQTTFVMAVALSVLLLIVSYLVPPDDVAWLRYTALLLPLLSFVGLRRKALRALGRLKASIILEEVLLPVVAILTILLAVMLYAGEVSDAGIVVVYALSALVVFIVSNWWLRRSLPGAAREAKPEFRARMWMAVALPMAFGGVSQALMSTSDVILLRALTDPETVGLYNAAAKISRLGVFSLGAVNAAVAPMISAAFYNGRPGQARRLQHRAMLLSALGALPIVAFVMLFPEFLLGFFGPEFVEATPVLRILALGYLVNAATGPTGFALLMTGRERIFATTVTIVAVCAVVGNLLVIPVYGAVGAAVVTAVSISLLNCWHYAISMQSSSVDAEPGNR